MRNKLAKLSGLVASLAAVLLVGLLLSGCKKEEESVTRIFPPKLDERVEFHQSKNPEREEKFRIVQYAPDKVTRTGLHIEYKNRNSADIVFRTTGPAKGTIESVTVKYPAKEGSTNRALARQLLLDVDGKTYLNDKVWREDGVMQYAAERVSEVKFVASEFRADGVTVQRKQEFLRVYGTWKLDLEERYRPDMSVETSVRRLDDGSVVTKKFTDDNKIASRAVLDRYESELNTEFYAEGQVVKRVNQTSYDVTVTLYKNGKTTEERRFYGSYNYMVVSLYDDNGKLRYKQNWSPKNYGDIRTNGVVDPTKFKLSNLDYFEDASFPVKSITFYGDGATPEVIRTHDPKTGSWYYPSVVKRFRTDGTLSEVSETDGGGRTIKKETHTADENIRETIDPADVQMRPFDNPPEMQKRSNPYSWGRGW